MTYDPIQQKWDGNEEILLDFDKASLASVNAVNRLRPALITNKGSASMIPQVVGNMVFDPIQMRWLGNEEEGDVFAGIDDDLNDFNNSKSISKGITSKNFRNILI